MKTRTLILLGLSSFAVTLLAYLPAQWLVSKLPAGFPLQLGGVSGTVWHGAAQQAQYQILQLHDIQWNFRPTDLLKAQLGTNLQGKIANLPGSIDIAGQAGLGLNGQYHADLTFRPSPQVNATTRALLGNYGTAQPDGSVHCCTPEQFKQLNL